MGKTKLIAIAGLALLLTGCSASTTDSARSACISAAEEEVGSSINAGEIKAGSLDEALFEAGITDDREADGGNDMYTVSGEFTFEKDGAESRRTMICTVKYEDGTPGEPDLTVVGG